VVFIPFATAADEAMDSKFHQVKHAISGQPSKVYVARAKAIVRQKALFPAYVSARSFYQLSILSNVSIIS
jgi:hypothetical protein